MNQSEAVRTSSPASDAEIAVSGGPHAKDGKSDTVSRPSLWIRLARFLNRPKLVWHRMPGQWLGYVNLFVQRMALQKANLFDTGVVKPVNMPVLPLNAVDMAARTADGSYNDLRCPFTGMAGTRFGRKIGRAHV